MFEGMTGTQQEHVWIWLASAFAICFLAHSLRKVIERFFDRKYRISRDFANFESICGENSEIKDSHDSRENALNRGKSLETSANFTESFENASKSWCFAKDLGDSEQLQADSATLNGNLQKKSES